MNFNYNNYSFIFYYIINQSIHFNYNKIIYNIYQIIIIIYYKLNIKNHKY